MNSIFHHVSIRKYKNQPVEKEKIPRILKSWYAVPKCMKSATMGILCSNK